MRIGRFTLMALAALACATHVAAQDTATVDPGDSVIDDRWRGLAITLAVSRPVPWRVFTLDHPPRLVIEMQGAIWSSGPDHMITGENASGVVVRAREDGWTRLDVTLARPLAVEEAGMAVDPVSGAARLRLVLVATDAESFAAQAEAGDEDQAPAPTAPAGDRFVVAIDPGHGGFDPGAGRAGVREAHLMLALGQEIAAALKTGGADAVLTRQDDSFVALEDRIARARAAGADVLVSLHADSLDEDQASGASVYTLTAEAVAGASERTVQRHAGSNLLTGSDLTGQDDAVSGALLDLARGDTAARSERLAQTLVQSLDEAGAAVNSRPLRRASLAVLLAADIPGVLLETGFLSDDADRARLATPEGRAPIVRGVVAALRTWAEADAAIAPPMNR